MFRQRITCVGTVLVIFSSLTALVLNRNILTLIISDDLGNCFAAKAHEEDDSVPVFYNLYVSNESDAPRVKKLVLNQLSYLLPEHSVYVNSIGFPLQIPDSRVLVHRQEGSEMQTLHSLWEYCSINTRTKVIYLHSKGSFHPSKKNDALRSFLTVGALSRECLDLPEHCDVCASRVSPGPHPHVPGNMFLAQCSHVRKLIDPLLFEATMDSINISNPSGLPHCVGRRRFAAEHWILSHPLARPCDLCNDPRYILGYYHVPSSDFQKRLAMVPRFDASVYIRPGRCQTSGQFVKGRLEEYRQLYNETPLSTWWGWKYFDGVSSMA